jgi:hypothetical protein
LTTSLAGITAASFLPQILHYSDTMEFQGIDLGDTFSLFEYPVADSHYAELEAQIHNMAIAPRQEELKAGKRGPAPSSESAH